MAILARFFPHMRAFFLGCLFAGAAASLGAYVRLGRIEETQAKRKALENAFREYAVQVLLDQEARLELLESKTLKKGR